MNVNGLYVIREHQCNYGRVQDAIFDGWLESAAANVAVSHVADPVDS